MRQPFISKSLSSLPQDVVEIGYVVLDNLATWFWIIFFNKFHQCVAISQFERTGCTIRENC